MLYKVHLKATHVSGWSGQWEDRILADSTSQAMALASHRAGIDGTDWSVHVRKCRPMISRWGGDGDGLDRVLGLL
jgi:hypothetical protein